VTALVIRTGVTTARVAVVLGMLSTLVLVRAGVPMPVLLAVVGACLLGTLVVERDAARFRPWALYTLAFVLFAHLRGFADETGLATHVAYPADADRALFGVVPTVWLQEHLYVPGVAGALEMACIAVYVSYFLVPHVVAFALWRRNIDRFRRYAREIVLACYFGLTVSFVVPTAPPWLAGQLGEIPFVARVVKDVSNGAGANAYREGYEIVGVNPVAAMPSLHTALTVVIALAALRAGRAWGMLGVAYAAAMCFSLVYLGEHYVVDVVAGIATALVAAGLAPLAQRALERAKPHVSGAFLRLRG
jgi:membrane-associated phospholipid phosphatase